jgi:preprotein translocase subunit SecD
VQNFAFTLGLTTLIDVLVVFMFTKPLVTLLVRRDFFGKGHPLSGLNPERVGLRPRTGRQAAARPTAGVSARSSSREA